MFSILIFFIITVYLIKRINDIIGFDIGVKVKKESINSKYFEKSATEEDDEKKMENSSNPFGDAYPQFDANDFVERAKRAFEIIFKAYAAGDKSTLNRLLSKNMYRAFAKAIDDRNMRGEILQGTIERFVKVEIIDAGISGDDLFVIIQFVSEQSNVLKSKSGDILEGSHDFIEMRTEIFSFFRKRTAPDNQWMLCEIKDSANDGMASGPGSK
ncbi:MAG: Tim44/TimA family putative adaptor protein [Holosporaceae bacterium]|jgi:predicted lipid-binding transport protein (Tim44 family)|nr:Tim44/TimA family putative adaptor protein [Holosporaceae bacterium]